MSLQDKPRLVESQFALTASAHAFSPQSTHILNFDFPAFLLPNFNIAIRLYSDHAATHDRGVCVALVCVPPWSINLRRPLKIVSPRSLLIPPPLSHGPWAMTLFGILRPDSEKKRAASPLCPVGRSFQTVLGRRLTRTWSSSSKSELGLNKKKRDDRENERRG